MRRVVVVNSSDLDLVSQRPHLIMNHSLIEVSMNRRLVATMRETVLPRVKERCVEPLIQRHLIRFIQGTGGSCCLGFLQEKVELLELNEPPEFIRRNHVLSQALLSSPPLRRESTQYGPRALSGFRTRGSPEKCSGGTPLFGGIRTATPRYGYLIVAWRRRSSSSPSPWLDYRIPLSLTAS